MAPQQDENDVAASETSASPQQQQQQQQEEEVDNEMSLEELLYSTASFHAISKPVALTMILTALAVTYIYTPETFAATQDALTEAYVAFSPPQNASTAVQVGLSVTNALIIVSVICALTFVIVLLYKYRCLKLLIGYMVLSSAALLGVLGGNMFRMAIIVYNLAVDQFSFYFCIYNFALVGVPAIFSPWGGFPIIITQGYLIATSVILAWQLSAFDPWTAWVLLIMLALYDLCAVLTPCGPLKALVNLMSQDDAPDMPGLLYDAELPIEAQRPGRNRASTRATATASTTRQSNNTSSAATVQSTAITTASTQQQESDSEESKSVDSDVVPLVSSFHDIPPATASQHRMSDDAGIEVSRTATDEEAAPPPFSTSGPAPVTVADRLSQTRAAASTTRQSIPVQAVTGTEQRQRRPRATLPFAIAKLYNLPLESEEPQQRSSWTAPAEGEHLSPNELLARQHTPEQLCSDVVAIFPRNGGRIEHVGHRYMVKDRHGNLKRVLLMDEQGHVLEERQRTPEEFREQERNSNSIKLGLGDFIFYSVLVSKAILYGFTTFAACFLVILAGLGATLVLLAVYHKALPALPISIALGVIAYLSTRWCIEPWYEAVLRTPYYV